jgi:hypothetical protein
MMLVRITLYIKKAVIVTEDRKAMSEYESSERKKSRLPRDFLNRSKALFIIIEPGSS